MNKGYIYIIFNEMYNFYGLNVYKVGKTQDITKRTKHFTTAYIEPVEIKFLSEEVQNYTLAEQEAFKILGKSRIKPNREFFRIDNLKDVINKIETMIDEINLLSEAEIELKLEQNKAEKHNNYNKLLNDMKKVKLDDIDIIIELLKPHSECEKVKMLNEFETVYDIPRFDISIDRVKTIKTVDDNIFFTFTKSFESTKTKPKNKNELRKLYNGFLRNITNNNKFIESKQIRYKGTKQTIYYFNKDTTDKVKERINDNNLNELLNKEYLSRYFN